MNEPLSSMLSFAKTLQSLNVYEMYSHTKKEKQYCCWFDHAKTLYT